MLQSNIASAVSSKSYPNINHPSKVSKSRILVSFKLWLGKISGYELFSVFWACEAKQIKMSYLLPTCHHGKTKKHRHPQEQQGKIRKYDEVTRSSKFKLSRRKISKVSRCENNQLRLRVLPLRPQHICLLQLCPLYLYQFYGSSPIPGFCIAHTSPT